MNALGSGPYAKQCRCGFPIWVDTSWNGLAYVPHFYRLESEREIFFCPDCGESLIFPNLQNRED